ncbi:CKLF-like MARVEL transmembrane domain-containing protein 8 isoform X2 [Delphinapterus leucas]|uniref:CKLF-like MARVEL transmembrane domain-containing protein 8 isoform X2 n=1 Tax=Delphinapterus leucas TaxID=9749 RepID=A0A2Y9LKY3_DELLE|nr:CKLF-like MARVEL transmembrane domain-containing protein 8 isoform X2 [Delphinapterus leucas]
MLLIFFFFLNVVTCKPLLVYCCDHLCWTSSICHLDALSTRLSTLQADLHGSCPGSPLMSHWIPMSSRHPQEAVLGLLVWTLIAGTEYFRVPAFGWVMFVAVFYWVLTVFFLIIYITMTYTRIPQGLCFNGSAFVLYLSAAIVDASSVSPERDSHNFNSWAASSFFAFLVTICYAGNTYFSFIAWRSRTIQ